MSAEGQAAASLPISTPCLPVLRYAVGSAMAMAVAMGFGWPLSFLTPVLTLSFLATPAPRPSLKEGLVFVVTVLLACTVGGLLARYLLPYPLVFIPFTGYLLFRVFHAQRSGRSPLLTTWLMIALLVIPLLAMMLPGLGTGVAAGIVVGAAATISMVWLTYGLFPDPAPEIPGGGAATKAPLPTPEERLRDASLSTLVVFPVFVLFYTLQLGDSLLILVFIALLAQQPAFAANLRVGKALILGNIMGGVAAILFYELLVLVPEFWFLILLTLLAGLIFGARVFSGKPTSPLYAMAFSTVLLVIGSTTSGSGEAGSKVYSRVFQLILAVSYVVLAFAVIERFRRVRESET